MKHLTILGSTGSIGTSTLDVVGRQPEQYKVFALVAGANTELLAEQIVRFRPRIAAVSTEAGRSELVTRLAALGMAAKDRPEVLWGPKAYVAAATAPQTDFVMSAIVGVAGLESTYEAVRLGKRVGLANKEVLVACGKLVIEAALRAGTEMIPVDSEHNGAHQSLRAGARGEVTRLILTASGGPFRETPLERLRDVTPQQALNHPTWKMGRRITIDSATMMNKGFEVIEACWLFGLKAEEVDVVIHPQSTVHAMVEYVDGSVIAQVSATDMRMPIQYALTYPDREASPVPRLDWEQARTWTFHPPDFEKFPLLKMAYRAHEAGGTAACTLNAADEIAVEAFLRGAIPFPQIADVVAETLSRMPSSDAHSVAEILDCDARSRAVAGEIVRERSNAVLEAPFYLKA